MADLTDIDQHLKSTAPVPRMDRLTAQMSDDELDVLKRACGLGDNPNDRRPHTAIAAWLNGLGYDAGGRVDDDHVSRWAAKHG